LKEIDSLDEKLKKGLMDETFDPFKYLLENFVNYYEIS
jgi:hypothetical protein